MNKKTSLQITFISLMIMLSGCKNETQTQESYQYRVNGDTVMVLDSVLSKNLHVHAVNMVPFSKEVVTAGTVCPILTQYANIAPPFAGRIIRSFVKMGQNVSKGTPLFAITCPDFTSAQKDYFQALSTREIAEKDLKRKKELAVNGVSSQKELEEASNTLLIAEKDFENARAALEVYQVEDFKHMNLGQPLIVRAPISGDVIENNIVNGQYVKDDSDPIAVVADLSKVWVSAQVKEKDIRYINEGSVLDIEISAYPDMRISGKVYHIEEALDEDTRSIRVLSECPNNNETLKLGMYTTVHFHGTPSDMIQIPESALLQGPDYSYVFVQQQPDIYVRRRVTVEATKNKKAVISSGLNKGDKVIVQGGYYIKM